MVQKIMERESALKVIDDIKNKICDIDLDDLCGEKAEVLQGDKTDDTYNKLIQAVMCGLVYWDDNENCMVQELIHPVKSGDMTADKFYFKYPVTLGEAKDIASRAANQMQASVNILSHITGRAAHLIENLRGQDVPIAMGCVGFFDR